MRGAILSMAVFSATIPAIVSTIPAWAETPPTRPFRPISSPRVAIPIASRPPAPPSVMPRMVSTPTRPPPHCPDPPSKPPVSVSVPKPDYSKRAMALIQQNIAITAALRAAETQAPCDPSWSARQLARRGCPPVPTSPGPMLEPPPGPPAAPEPIAAAAPSALVAEN